MAAIYKLEIRIEMEVNFRKRVTFLVNLGW